jgi:hypothetical protein
MMLALFEPKTTVPRIAPEDEPRQLNEHRLRYSDSRCRSANSSYSLTAGMQATRHVQRQWPGICRTGGAAQSARHQYGGSDAAR